MPFGVNSKTGRPGPAPKPAQDGNKIQARHRVNMQIRHGARPRPNDLPCADCGHVWREGERRHEYDHHLGHDAAHHEDVEPVCTTCHARRDNAKATATHCTRGHEFTAENAIIKTNGTRQCRECRRAHDRKRQRPEGYWKAVNARRRVSGGTHG